MLNNQICAFLYRSVKKKKKKKKKEKPLVLESGSLFLAVVSVCRRRVQERLGEYFACGITKGILRNAS